MHLSSALFPFELPYQLYIRVEGNPEKIAWTWHSFQARVEGLKRSGSSKAKQLAHDHSLVMSFGRHSITLAKFFNSSKPFQRASSVSLTCANVRSIFSLRDRWSSLPFSR
jgi:hypothetical protein